MDEPQIVEGQTRTRRLLQWMMISSIVLAISAVAYPLSSGPAIYLADKFAGTCDVQEPVEAIYQPVLLISDAIGAGWLVNKYLVMFDVTATMRHRQVMSRTTHARKLIASGRLRRVQQWDCRFSLFDDRPELIIADISQHRKTTLP